MQLITSEVVKDHPLENMFNITPNSTVVEVTEVAPLDQVEMNNYDAKDLEIGDQLEEIYAVAMSGATEISDGMGSLEGRYKAKSGETCATMLSVALEAVRTKANIKIHKDKLGPTKQATQVNGNQTNITNNNLITADRNEIMRMIRGEV